MSNFLSHQTMLVFIAGLVGLVVSSFLNRIIFRMPIKLRNEQLEFCAELKGEETSHHDPIPPSPRLKCMNCGQHFSALERIPLLGYIVSRGQCSSCKSRLPFRYLLVELTSTLLSAFMVWKFGLTTLGIAGLLFAWCVIALTFIDLETQYLPYEITQFLLWAGLVLSLGVFGKAFAENLNSAVIGAVIGFYVLWVANLICKLLIKKEGMGDGDFILLAAIGAWLGWQMLPQIVFISSFIGAVVGLSQKFAKGFGLYHRIPFGPYLILAALIALFWGREVNLWYCEFSGRALCL